MQAHQQEAATNGQAFWGQPAVTGMYSLTTQPIHTSFFAFMLWCSPSPFQTQLVARNLSATSICTHSHCQQHSLLKFLAVPRS
eukprot:5677844-Amphidinium_carterae.1